MDADTLLTKLAGYFKKDRRIVAAYLFGSRACGRASPASDIDIALLLDLGIRRRQFEDIALKQTSGLMQILKCDRIDILILNSAGPVARHQVYRKGRMIFCRDQRLAMRFRDTAVAEYLDFLPFRRRAEETVLRRLAAGGRHG